MAVRKVMVSLVDCQPSGVRWTGQLDWTPPDSTGLQSGCFEWFSNGYGWPLSLVESGGVRRSPTGLCGGEIRTPFLVVSCEVKQWEILQMLQTSLILTTM